MPRAPQKLELPLAMTKRQLQSVHANVFLYRYIQHTSVIIEVREQGVTPKPTESKPIENDRQRQFPTTMKPTSFDTILKKT